ncbi:MAG: GNAT family N-acetyltransferase [Galactobacter sp.]
MPRSTALIPFDSVHVVQDLARERYDLFDGEQFIGFVGYTAEYGVVDLQHTIIKEEFSRRGYARALVTIVLERLWARDEKIIPTFSYVVQYLERFPQYKVLLHQS